ncbi:MULTISPECIES: hypothetical protein [Flammeovirga]|uniref:Uncharacterized protein n=1 Tax=Flammeovirga agarivorans TaxID=2726742 RepID=A0A7X8SNN0_9BACT|nr:MULTISPECIES: hypothetical protein [Flammeovirga]NLR93554.1 hypothetical protein [Flammeovirga agarivorans]
MKNLLLITTTCIIATATANAQGLNIKTVQAEKENKTIHQLVEDRAQVRKEKRAAKKKEKESISFHEAVKNIVRKEDLS